MPPKNREKSEAGNSSSRLGGEGVKDAIGSVTQLAMKALERDSPLSGKIFVMAIAGVLLALPIAGLLIYKGYGNGGLILCLSAIILLCLAIIMFGFYYRESVPEPLRRWHRQVPICARFREEDLDDLSSRLETVRTKAFDFLKEKHSELKNDYVRAAIFLPKFDDVEQAVVCTLHIPPKLRKQLYRKEEWDFEVRPGEGVCGDVFLNNKMRIEGRAFGLPDPKLLQPIHPNLKWIVGFPLNHPQTHETMGSLCIDLLFWECDNSLLAQMSDVIRPRVDDLTLQLAKLPQAEISIRVDERFVQS